MFCPECGAEAGAAKYCPECGSDLRGLAATPDCVECGAELPEGARFCPECGEPTAAAEAPAAAAAGAAGGRRTGTRGRSAGAGQQRQQRRQQPRPQQAAAARTATQPTRVSPALAWGILAVVVAAAIVVVVVFAGRSGDSGAAGTTAAPRPAQSVAADTSGSYGELVDRANGLYDQGAAQLQSQQWDQAAAYFLAASKVYAAAWKLQSTSPAVGTDYATSLFYAGRIEAAITQVEKVLAQSPDFQTAWFNKGNYLSEQARLAGEAGDTKAADKAYAAARIAYQKAVDLDPASASGQSAKERLDQLPD